MGDNFTQRFSFLEKNKHHISDDTVKHIHEAVFEKTDCLECGNCCKSAPPIIKNQDIKRIAKHLAIPPKTFKRKYVLEDIDGSLSFNYVPCHFLQEDNRCSIYEVRPEACRDYPHTDQHFFKRKELHKENSIICPAVEKILIKMEQIIQKNKS